MRILHTGMGWFSEDAGGLSRYMSQAVVDQNRSGHIAKGLVTGTERTVEASGGLVAPFAPRNDRMDRRLGGLRRTFRGARDEFRPDLATFHFSLYARPVMDLLRGLPWVMHFHGPWALEGRAEGANPTVQWLKKNFVESPVYRRAPRVVTLSECFAGILRDQYGVAPERIRVVPGGFDPEAFLAAPGRSEARRKLGFPPEAPLVVCVRRLASRMGLENLVDAVGLLRSSHPGLVVAIAGKGPLSGALQEHILAAGLQDRIRLLGFVPDEDLPSLYAAGDVSVVPTVALEGFGLIVAESLAAGTPVIASRVGALPELLGGFHDALLADPTSQGLASVLDRALTQPGFLPDADRCREHARRWSWEEVTPRLIRVYEEAIEDSRNLRS